MAHGFLQSFDKTLEVFSAGTKPADKVNPLAVEVMAEAGVDISDHKPHNVNEYTGQAWDYVITVCDEANETCPVFTGDVKHRLHIGFCDPSKAEGTPEFIKDQFLRTRFEIKNKFAEFYLTQILKKEMPKCACSCDSEPDPNKAGSNEQLKELVRQKYSEIALSDGEESCCCGDSPKTEVYNIMSDDYSALEGYHEDADLGLGCGVPTQYAGIRKGDTVIDLGSGAGNDCFVAQAEVGPEGKVIGIDFSEPMIEKAKANAQKRGVQNVSFRKGDIENMPISTNRADVVISNCVLNLLPSKDRIFHEIYRVLKPDGHFCISDIVLKGEIPAKLKEAAEMYVGCVSGAIPEAQYLANISKAGFTEIRICKEKPIIIPDDILEQYLDEEELSAFKTISGNAIVSITVTGTKPSGKCACGGCC